MVYAHTCIDNAQSISQNKNSKSQISIWGRVIHLWPSPLINNLIAQTLKCGTNLCTCNVKLISKKKEKNQKLNVE